MVRRWFPATGFVLELGGGNGYQARTIADWGYNIDSIDISCSASTYFPVRSYDGKHIPFPEKKFDIVFSSNVLEHVPPSHLTTLLSETRRVLRDDGCSIHVLPTPSWRLWTSLTHYPSVYRMVRSHFSHGPRSATERSAAAILARRSCLSRAHSFILWALTEPLRSHGEYPSAFSELFYFSRRRWERLFRAAGFRVVVSEGNGLFYSGNAICPWLTVAGRRRLARLLGSSCNFFVLN